MNEKGAQGAGSLHRVSFRGFQIPFIINLLTKYPLLFFDEFKDPVDFISRDLHKIGSHWQFLNI